MVRPELLKNISNPELEVKRPLQKSTNYKHNKWTPPWPTLVESAFVFSDNNICAKFSFVVVIGPVLAKGVVSLMHAVAENLLGWGLERFAVGEWEVELVLDVNY